MPIISVGGRIVIRDELCTCCGLCVLACPEGCLQLWPDPDREGRRSLVYIAEGCRADGLCAYACPESGAIALEEAA